MAEHVAEIKETEFEKTVKQSKGLVRVLTYGMN